MNTSARRSAAVLLAALVTVASGCRGSPTATPTPHDRPSAHPAIATTPTPSPSKKVDPSENVACAKARDVRATYVVHTEPTATGQQIWLTLRLRNTGDHGAEGETGGELFVSHPDPGQPPVIEWGGSSADGIGAHRHGTSTQPILNIIGKKLRASRTSRVTLLGVYTAIWGHRGATCLIPAHMRAPQHLVAAHPHGSWFLSVHKGMRIRNIGFRRNLTQN